MKSKLRNIFSIVLCVLTLLTAFPVFAASTGSVATDESIGEDVVQGAKTEYSEVGIGGASTDAYLTVDDKNVLVKVPTTVILNGEADALGNYVGEYSVQVSGDIAGNEALVVQPKADTVSLSQEGKADESATITQNKTVFTYEDLQSNEITEETISANGLTAGSWNGSGTFDIQITSKMQYYSSVELAATDANALNYDNADCKTAQDENAVAALYVDEDESQATIRLLKDVSNVQSFTLDNNTTLDLDNNTLSFDEGQYLTYKDDFTAYDGKLISQNANYSIFGDKANTESNFSLSRIDFESTITDTLKSNSFIIDSSSVSKDIQDCDFIIEGVGSSRYGAAAIMIYNNSSVNDIQNCKMSFDLDNATALVGIQSYGDVVSSNILIDIYAINCSQVSGFVNNTNLVVNNSKVNISIADNTTLGAIRAISSNRGTLSINGGNYFCEVIQEENGSGICVSNGDLNINSTDENPVIVYGKEWGIQTSPNGVNTINGGEYSSTNHLAYICGNANVYNAKFYSANRDKYDIVDTCYGVYCGDSRQDTNCVVNMYDCVIGTEEPEGRQFHYGITAKSNDGYKPSAEVNLYDCVVYKGTDNLFNYNRATADNMNYCKFNIYGNTVFYDRNCNIIDKETLAESINTWKTIANTSGIIGDSLIHGYVGNVDKNTGKILALYVTDDANVYDYRD